MVTAWLIIPWSMQGLLMVGMQLMQSQHQRPLGMQPMQSLHQRPHMRIMEVLP